MFCVSQPYDSSEDSLHLNPHDSTFSRRIPSFTWLCNSSWQNVRLAFHLLTFPRKDSDTHLVYVGSFFAMLNARERSDNGSSRNDLESSRGTQLRVHLHTVSYTTTTPSSPPSAASKVCPCILYLSWTNVFWTRINHSRHIRGRSIVVVVPCEFFRDYQSFLIVNPFIEQETCPFRHVIHVPLAVRRSSQSLFILYFIFTVSSGSTGHSTYTRICCTECNNDYVNAS